MTARLNASEQAELMKSPYLITDIETFSPQIGHLVCMMNYVRQTTLAEVTDLSMEELDFLLDKKSNSIGALLSHIAAVEVAYQVATFGFGERELDQWQVSLNLGEPARRELRGHNIRHYLKMLSEVRTRTFSEFAKRDDPWLYEETPFWGGLPANNYFKWFHVFEDELNHRGQIRLIRKRLPSFV
jgi:uncharacterized damage-inducible protein DinB